MRISVFGIGYVGAVSSACLARMGHSVLGVDVSPEKVAMLEAGQSPIIEHDVSALIERARAEGRLRATTDAMKAVAESDLSLVSVATPNLADGSVSLRSVRVVVEQIARAISRKNGAHSIVMRSTVPPGTAEEELIPLLEQLSGRRLGEGVSYYSNPEFLREGSAVSDFHAPPFTLIGAAPDDQAHLARELYASIAAPIHVVPYRVAEAVKFVSNVFHAVKLAFANEAGAVLAAHDIDAREVFRLFSEDRILNISPAYLRPGFAFGGSCLPKDLRGFLALADRKTVSAPMLSHVLPSNDAIIERVYRAVVQHGRQPIALFGLAFKPGTDDLRESPFVALAERLIGRGWDVRIFDRNVNVATLVGSNRRYIDQEIPHLERLLAPSPADALNGCRLAVIGHIERQDRPSLLAALDQHSIIDLAGLPELRERAGIRYQGVCW